MTFWVCGLLFYFLGFGVTFWLVGFWGYFLTFWVLGLLLEFLGLWVTFWLFGCWTYFFNVWLTFWLFVFLEYFLTFCVFPDPLPPPPPTLHPLATTRKHQPEADMKCIKQYTGNDPNHYFHKQISNRRKQKEGNMKNDKFTPTPPSPPTNYKAIPTSPQF